MGEAVTRLQALLGLASEGVCGPLRTSYLRRRLARETDEDVVIGLMPSDDGRARRYGGLRHGTLPDHMPSLSRSVCEAARGGAERGGAPALWRMVGRTVCSPGA